VAKRPPIYRKHNKCHRADTCKALVDATTNGEVRLEALVRGAYPGRSLPPGALPHLKSVGFWHADHDQDWGLDWHRNEGIEITFLESGEIGFGVNNHRYAPRPGDLMITRPWQPHTVGTPTIGASRLHWLILDVGVRQPHQAWKWPTWLILDRRDLKELTAMLRENEQPVWRGNHEVEDCFRRISQLVENFETSSTATSRLTLLINELFVVVLEMLRVHDIKREGSLLHAERTTAMFLHELESSLEKAWTIDIMADCAGLKRTRFAHYCKRLKNMTPVQYLNHLRVEKGKILLRERPDLSLAEMGLQCGFYSGQYFATAFKRLEGLTPGQYRSEK